MILLAPILFAASVYMILGRLIRATGAESYAVIRVTWITKIFVGGDILCFMIQAAGGGILAGADTTSQKNLGQNIILAGLVLQIVIFVGFIVITVVYHMRLRARPTGKGPVMISWERLLVMLYVVSVVITLRNLFRCIEYGMGGMLSESPAGMNSC
jgi:heme/copper-type cytochrome/quinol oxidase subunit 2